MMQAVLVILGVLFWIVGGLIAFILAQDTGGALHELLAATCVGFGTLFFASARALTYLERQAAASEKGVDATIAMHRTIALQGNLDVEAMFPEPKQAEEPKRYNRFSTQRA